MTRASPIWPAMRMPGSTRDGIAGRADRTRAPGGTSSRATFAAAEVMPLDDARETAALADADHVHLLVGLELIDQHLVARLEVVVAGPQPKLPRNFTPSTPAFFRCPVAGLLMRAGLMNSIKPELHRVVTVARRRLALDHHARTSLQQRHRHHLPVRPEDLCHTDLSAKNSWGHNNSGDRIQVNL